ncbi:MAG: bifunctional UDP-N-acetylmuramoyl-tripeptide:D-alanyl-D-alanine ligase/alanine racemase [Flavipsychrobacter sp.]
MMTNATHRPDAKQIKAWCDGVWLQQGEEGKLIEALAIDSRKIALADETLFIALRTEHRNGHAFLKQVYEKGVRNFLVSEDIETAAFPQANIIKVEDTLKALQTIATEYRNLFDLPVIGITGSNGKTIVKEWLGQLLGNEYKTVRSPKSYNSQIGVPLSVWLLDEEYEIAIFEAGISLPGEMERLEKIIKPEIGVFTNIGDAHSEGFVDDTHKIKEKLQLFKHAKQLVYCKDHEAIANEVTAFAKEKTLCSWSRTGKADIEIVSEIAKESKTEIEAKYKGDSFYFTIPFTDKASIENAIHCACVMLLLSMDKQQIAEAMEQLHAVSMRMEVVRGVHECTLINDSYNSDFTSLQLALDYLAQQHQHSKHTLILSDMMQIAQPDAVLYAEVAELISHKSVTRFIGIGSAIAKYKELFEKYDYESVFYSSMEDFLDDFQRLKFGNEAVLLKGARHYSFERISTLLEEKTHETELSINLSAITHNIGVIRKALKPKVKIMGMVKAFSYGSGSYEIANHLQFLGIDYLSVAYTDEGIALRQAGITLPIMVMSPDVDSFNRMVAWQLEPEVYNMRSLKAIVAIAKTMNLNAYPIHVKLDTGMHRLGFDKEDLDACLEILVDTSVSNHLRVVSAFSHLAASEDETLDNFTEEQGQQFKVMTQRLEDSLGYSFLKHIVNSAGITRHPELQCDMVRLGIGMYGVGSDKQMASKFKQVSTLKTTVAQIKKIPAGDTVGYNRRGVAIKEMKIATVSIGYADGYPRALGNGNAYMLIHGKEAKLVGSVCMDMCMLDITNIEGVKEGDDVMVFGEELPVIQLAQWAGTIPYEILTGISERVKRVYEREI